MGMASTLIINPGSSSKKYALYQNDREVLRVTVEQTNSGVTYQTNVGGSWRKEASLPEADYAAALERVLETAVTECCITSRADITAVGLRMVAPGERWQRHQLFTDELRVALESVVATAPLHIPPILQEFSVVKNVLPEVSVVAVSDSAFHSTLPAVASEYSIDQELAREHSVKRYGYHGISVASVLRQLGALGIPTTRRTIVCHIGSGVSVTAVLDGESIDTTMGYSPGSGVVMASRSGDLDAGALLELMRQHGWDVAAAQKFLQTQSGLRGLAGESDIRHLLERSASGDRVATSALSLFSYHIRKQIGAMAAALGGVDVVVCTATVGSRSPELRAQILAPLQDLGITIDTDKNDQAIDKKLVISPDNAAVTVAVIPTDELREMALVTTQVCPVSVRDGQD